jgi:hypothetical protein
LEHWQKEFDQRFDGLLLIADQVGRRIDPFDFFGANGTDDQHRSVFVVTLLQDGHSMIKTKFDGLGRFSTTRTVVSLTGHRFPTCVLFQLAQLFPLQRQFVKSWKKLNGKNTPKKKTVISLTIESVSYNLIEKGALSSRTKEGRHRTNHQKARRHVRERES